jgi:type I restriction enzyme S subunit
MSNKVNNKFKKTEIGLIPEEWAVLPLIKAVDFNPTRELKKGTRSKFVAMTDVKPYTKEISSYSTKEFSGGTKFKNGDTLMARITPCLENGKTAYVDFLKDKEVAGGSTEFIVLSGKDGVSESEFVYYLSISPQVREVAIKSMTGTSGRQRVENGKFSNHKIALPTLVEQKNIIEILSSIDKKINLNQKINNNLEKLASAIFKKWFIDTESRLPKGWKIGLVSDLIRVESGFPFNSKMFDETGDYKLVTIKNVQDGFFVPECTDSLNKIPSKMPSHCKLKNGDVLLSLTGNVGRVCLIYGENYLLNQRVANLVPINENNRAFTYFLFRQKDFQNTLVSISHGTAQQNLSPIETKSLEIVIPSQEALDSFADVANPIFQKLVENNKEIGTLSATRNTLLPRLMSGKIRV